MKNTGTIKVVGKSGRIYKCRMYHNKEEMLNIIEAFSFSRAIVSGSQFIHVIPTPEELTPEEELNIYYMQKLKPEQEQLIKENLNLIKSKDLAHLAGVSLSTIRNKKIANMKKQIIHFKEFDPPKPIERPKGNYSNQRLYDNI